MLTKDVSAFAAKTHLSAMLREAERGKSFVIRRRGKAVARLVPAAPESPAASIDDIVIAFRKLRANARGKLDVRSLIEAGRRF